jgi:CheY-like chemotaxis protein
VAVVLIFVDEPDTMLLLLRALEVGGHKAVLAADADVALGRLAALPVDLLIVDVMMPVRDGWTVLEAIRDSSEVSPAIVVLSGRAGPDDLKRATQLGAIGTLAVPFTPAQLDQVVDQALVATS